MLSSLFRSLLLFSLSHMRWLATYGCYSPSAASIYVCFRVEDKVRTLERRHSIERRWEPDEDAFSVHSERALERKVTRLKHNMHEVSKELRFFSDVRSKYAGRVTSMTGYQCSWRRLLCFND